MEFTKKTIAEFAEWLREEKFTEETVQIFKGKCIILAIIVKTGLYVIKSLDNEVDGESFLLLTDADLSGIIKAVGTRRRLRWWES